VPELAHRTFITLADLDKIDRPGRVMQAHITNADCRA
jgi:hypothetical protein